MIYPVSDGGVYFWKFPKMVLTVINGVDIMEDMGGNTAPGRKQRISATMFLSSTLPQSQGTYAVTAFSRGDVIHNADVIESRPVRQGFHAVFYPKGLSSKYVGPFKSRKEAYSVGASFADFSHVIEIA